jgi:hypothetical protein
MMKSTEWGVGKRFGGEAYKEQSRVLGYTMLPLYMPGIPHKLQIEIVSSLEYFLDDALLN